ncbi:FAD/NAD-P-binding domain-containing protein [Mycena maculata]|uniref:FAD/NAD-P-binding domain-containing protein n=1 Tax=Mycena maculata TaxID=230809 RepID=A0AAD7JNL2_9AGAR|nr:FAD/NAD-P-binding domain-containing protein [Mycena maculata]
MSLPTHPISVLMDIQDIVIVDSVLAGENASRAVVIHAATLEALNSVGCLDKLLKVGDKVHCLVLRDGASYLISVDFSLLAPYTNYPFGLVLPRDARNPGGAGGQGSAPVQGRVPEVRQEIGISFNDPDGDKVHDYGNMSQLVLGDVTFPPPALTALASLMDGNLVFLAPFPASVSPDPERLDGTAPHAPSTKYLESLLNRCAPSAVSSDPAVNPHLIRIEKTYWSSRYRTRSAIAERTFARFRDQRESGVVLLIGDAAHIHWPVGGQGMSLGIRDAISLGPALRAHIDSAVQDTPSDQDRLLADRAASRHGRARTVIVLTKGALGVMVGRRWLGFTLLRFMGSFKFVQRMVAYRLSGLAEI